MNTPQNRGIVLTRFLPILGLLCALALGTMMMDRPHACPVAPDDCSVSVVEPVVVPASAGSADAVKAEPVARTEPAATELADLVGLYRGNDDCVLRIDSRGVAKGCRLNGQLVNREGRIGRRTGAGVWSVTNDGVQVNEGQKIRSFRVIAVTEVQ